MAKKNSNPVVYQEKYIKGTTFDNKKKLIEYLNQNNVVAFLISAGQYEDETEFLEIKIDRIKA